MVMGLVVLCAVVAPDVESLDDAHVEVLEQIASYRTARAITSLAPLGNSPPIGVLDPWTALHDQLNRPTGTAVEQGDLVDTIGL